MNLYWLGTWIKPENPGLAISHSMAFEPVRITQLWNYDFYYFSNNYHFHLLSAAAHLNLGIVLSDMGHFEKALKVWNIFMIDCVGVLYLNLSIAKNSVRKAIKWSKPILQEVEVVLWTNEFYLQVLLFQIFGLQWCINCFSLFIQFTLLLLW